MSSIVERAAECRRSAPIRRAAGAMLATLAIALPTLDLRAAPSERAASGASPAPPLEELLARPIPLADPAGGTSQPITTPVGRAQAYYDQGMRHLGAFSWIAAARSFEECLRLDPDQPMARVGLARAHLGLELRGGFREHVLAAARTAARREITPEEQVWVELATLQLEAVDARGDRRRPAHRVYRDALDAGLAARPRDPHLLVLRGHAESRRADAWGQAGGRGSIRFYLAALAADLEHHSAHHFLTHAYENVGDYGKAVDHARRFLVHAAAVPHARHMMAHVLPRLGAWDEALEHLLEADRLHRAAFAAARTWPEHDRHFGHNLRLLAAVERRLGREQAAEGHYREAFHLPYDGRRAGFYCLPWLEYLLLRGRHEEALRDADRCAERDDPLAQLLGATLAGEALLGLDHRAEAEARLARARAAHDELLASRREVGSEHVFLTTARLALDVLAGKLAVRAGDVVGGRMRLLRLAEELASGTSFDAWTSGLVRLEELALDAHRAGEPTLARAIASTLALLDGDYEVALPP